jgi:hypothetical protein
MRPAASAARIRTAPDGDDKSALTSALGCRRSSALWHSASTPGASTRTSGRAHATNNSTTRILTWTPSAEHTLLDPYTSAQASEALGAAARFDIGGTAAHQNDAFAALGLRVDPLPHDVAAGTSCSSPATATSPSSTTRWRAAASRVFSPPRWPARPASIRAEADYFLAAAGAGASDY